MQEETRRRPQDQRSSEMRARLIAAGRRVFVEKGFADAGTPEIVAEAGVTRGSLYNHFADKTDMFRAVIRAEAEAVAAEINAAADTLDAGSAAWFAAMEAPGRVRLLLRDGPAVLGQAEMARIDAETGGATLRDGLAEVLGGGAEVAALADILSAGFDRAALAISEGADAAPYRAALGRVFTALLR